MCRLSRSLAQLPRGVFTNIWIVGQYPKDLAPPEGFVAVPDAGSGLLFEAVPGADQAAAR